VKPTPSLAARALRCPAVLADNVRCLTGVANATFLRAVELPVLRQITAAPEPGKPTTAPLLTQTPAETQFIGRYWVLYRLPAGAPAVFGEGYAGAGVSELAALLATRDGASMQQSIYGPRMVQRVIAYQRALGLTADGVVGPETWVALLPNRLGRYSKR
jgi:peptidoglycan hydrolase-like protein with peptidoglycan-binding domain